MGFFIHSTAKMFIDTMNAEIAKRRQENPEDGSTNTAEWLKHKTALQEEYPVKIPHFPTETIQVANGDGEQMDVARTRMSAQSVVTEMNKQILAKDQMDNCIF